MDGDWLNLRAGHAHLHVHLADLRGAQVQEPPHGAPIVQIIGRCGSPSLLLICDQTSGQAWREQMAVVDALRSRFGARCMFSSDDHAPSPAVLH